MPFKDPEKKKAYQRRYMAGYMRDYTPGYLERPDPVAGTKREKVRRDKARWFQANKKRLSARKAKQRRAAAIGDRITLAIGILDSRA